MRHPHPGLTPRVLAAQRGDHDGADREGAAEHHTRLQLFFGGLLSDHAVQKLILAVPGGSTACVHTHMHTVGGWPDGSASMEKGVLGGVTGTM